MCTAAWVNSARYQLLGMKKWVAAKHCRQAKRSRRIYTERLKWSLQFHYINNQSLLFTFTQNESIHTIKVANSFSCLPTLPNQNFYTILKQAAALFSWLPQLHLASFAVNIMRFNTSLSVFFQTVSMIFFNHFRMIFLVFIAAEIYLINLCMGQPQCSGVGQFHCEPQKGTHLELIFHLVSNYYPI